MLNSNRLFGTNGIRGLANKELTPQMAIKVGTAIGKGIREFRKASRGDFDDEDDAKTKTTVATSQVAEGQAKK